MENIEMIQKQIEFLNGELITISETMHELLPGTKEYVELSEQYNDKMGQLDKLIRLLADLNHKQETLALEKNKATAELELRLQQLENEKNNRKWGAVLGVSSLIATSAQIGAILNYEKLNSMTSKAVQFVQKNFDPRKYF